MAQAANTNELVIPEPAQNPPVPTHYGFFTAANGGGTWLGGEAVEAGTEYRFAPGQLVLQVPAGELNEAMAQRAVRGMIDGNIYPTLFSGDPGANGAANRIAGAHVAMPAANWTVS